MNIEFSDVKVDLGRAEILHGVSVCANDGQVTGIVGANGSGKSTLIKSLFGIVAPKAGEITVGGQSVATIGRRKLASMVGYVGQDSATVFDFSVHDVVGMAAGLRADRGSLKEVDIVSAALEELGISRLENRGIQSLSGGERKMVFIARAVAQGVDTIVLDEPTNHLDIKHQLFILDYLRSSGKTVLVVLHDLRLAAHFCDELYLVKSGRNVCSGTPSETLTRENVREVFGVRGEAFLDPEDGLDFKLYMS